MYDVVIVGGSFAGLAVAMQLRGYNVLLIDQRPIGAHQTSTCATPLPVAQAVGAAHSTQEIHGTLAIHVGGRELSFKLKEPYITFDYYAFCQAMLAQTDAEVWLARATGYKQDSTGQGTVTTNQGPVNARFVVDASGWQSLQRHEAPHDMRLLGYGMETELPVSLPLSPGLHFYFEKRIVRSGYAWVFPCGASTRIGVCSFDKGVHLRPLLEAFLERFGLQCGATHGGAMPIVRREPLAGDMFVVGDAAGQCLPIWAEGIRSTIFYATACGRAVADALNGTISADEARTRYAALTYSKADFQRLLLALHNFTAWLPERSRAAILSAISALRLDGTLIRLYIRGSG